MKFKLFLPALIGALFISCGEKQEPLSAVVERGLAVANQQSVLMANELEVLDGRLPRTFEGGEIQTAKYNAWISGFFPGTLWYLYENNPSGDLRKYANLYSMRVESAKDMKSTHDLGFMLFCSFGNGYRLTNNSAYLDIMKIGAESLASRFNDKVKAIKSWNSNEKWQYPVIIDNMMNLELLTYVSRETGDDRLWKIAEAHAQTTLENHFRPDYSCYHVVSYDTISGTPHTKGTHQGYSDQSAWARGQAWALYGYTMMYRQTHKPEYLEQARNVASFIINHPNLPEDKVPYWDFDAPEIPDTPRDASAAAIIASALIELSQLDKSADASKWLSFAEMQIRSLSSPQYLAEVGTNGYFILKHSVGNYNKKSEVDVPLSYADYYYVEALIRLKKLQNEK